jgi:deoxyhypusine synthase
MAKTSRFLQGPRIDPRPITGSTSIPELVDNSFLAYNAARLREACHLFVQEMLRDDVTIGLSVTGALTPAGLGMSAIIPLIENGFVDWIVSTGANLYHDAHFGIGLSMHVGSPKVNDIELREEGVVRIYDIFFEYDVLLSTDKFIRQVIAADEFQHEMSTAEFHHRLGKYIHEREKALGLGTKSLLSAAYQHGVPVYTSSPGDSSIGMNVAEKALDGYKLKFDVSLDVNETTSIVLAAKRSGGKSGVLILGGGSPKNFVLQTEPQIQEVLGIEEKGHDFYLQLTDARPDTGGLCVSEGTLIDMPRDLSQHPDGVPIESLVGQSGFYVYSYDHEQKKIVLSEVEKVWRTGVQQVWRLRYGWYTGRRKEKFREAEILATPDHLVMLSSGVYKPLKVLKPGEGVKAFNTSYSVHGYRQIGLGVGTTLAEHRYLLEFKLGRKLEAHEVAHHLDGNHLNNTLDNLAAEHYRTHVSEHRKRDWQRRTEPEKQRWGERQRQRMKNGVAQKMSRKFWDSMTPQGLEEYKNKKRIENLSAPPEIQQYRRKRAREWFKQLPKSEQRRIRSKISQRGLERWQNLSEPERERLHEKVRLDRNPRFKHEINEEQVREALVKSGGGIYRACEILKVDWRTLDRRFKMYGITRKEIEGRYADNHKVISVEPTGIIVPVYDMTVKRTRNFVANGIVVHNSGATPAEAVTWGKVDPTQLPYTVTCYLDSTVGLPILTAYALAKHPPRRPKRLYERRAEMLEKLKAEYQAAKAQRQEQP